MKGKLTKASNAYFSDNYIHSFHVNLQLCVGFFFLSPPPLFTISKLFKTLIQVRHPPPSFRAIFIIFSAFFTASLSHYRLVWDNWYVAIAD